MEAGRQPARNGSFVRSSSVPVCCAFAQGRKRKARREVSHGVQCHGEPEPCPWQLPPTGNREEDVPMNLGEVRGTGGRMA